MSSVGKRLSSSTRFRRSPTILSTCSMRTGQASTHAPQVTQSHTASYGIAVSTIGAAIRAGWGAASSRPYVSRTIGLFGMRFSPCSASTDMSRMPMMKVFGLSGLPVAQAGQACWQRPHSVHVKPSRRSFQPRSWSDFSPKVASSRSRSIAGSSPRGRSLRYQMFGNDVAMWRCLLNGRYTRNAATRTMWAHHRTAKPSSSPAAPTDARSGPARAADTNAPGWSPNRANSKTSAKSSVATTPPIIARMIRASRL